MTVAPEPVLQALVESAVSGTGGSDGWLLALRGSRLVVVGAAGPLAGSLMTTAVPADSGTAGFVVGSGQPIALAPRADDPRATSGMASALGRRPASVLCVPCDADDGIQGVLEVVDKYGGGMFTFDDIELATLLAGVAGVALRTFASAEARAPDPAELAGELRRLADNDPTRYAAVATILASLVASG